MALPKYQKAEKAAASPKDESKKRSRKQDASRPPAAAARKGAPRAVSSEPPRKQRGGKAGSATTFADAAQVAAARQTTITRALQEAECVSSEVCEMLCSALPGSLCTSGEFHPYQEKTLWMLNQTLKDIQREKTRQFQEVAGSLCRAKDELQCAEKEQANAEEAVVKSSAEATERNIALAQSTAALNICKLAVEPARTALWQGDAVIGASAMELEQLRSARATLQKLCSDNAPEDTTLATLQKLCSGWSLAPAKLENVTLLEGELCQRLAVLSGIVSKTAVARVGLVDQLDQAQARLEAANEEQRACAAAQARTQIEQHECNVIMKSKTLALKQQKAKASQTVRAWNIAQKKLAEFQKGARMAFQDSVTEIEQRHQVHLFHDKNAVDAAATSGILEEAKDADLSGLFGTYPTSGTPIIDRQQRQAVLRRRSAVLPRYCFSRLSLMARRSSILASKKRMDEMINGAQADATDSDEDNAMESMELDKGQMRHESEVLEGAATIPTPNRRPSIGSY